MTNIIKPYVPILRWRSAEMTAMEKLFPKDRSNVTPLIEFIMPAPSTDKKDRKKILKTPKEKFLETLPNVANDLSKSCGQSPVLIDVHLLDGDIRASSLDQILSASSELNIFSIPVTYVIPVTSTDADIETRSIAINYAKSSGHGLCIRIDNSHLLEPELASHLLNFIKNNNLDIQNIDLLVDLRFIPDIDTKKVIDELEKLPNLKEWRSFIVSGGVFPKDLTEFPAGAVYPLDRLDWKFWNTIRESKITRIPSFSDYTIQHPFYEYIAAIGSASIRYTADDQCWIFRGTKPGLINRKTQEKGPGREQYIAHAKTLIKRDFYKGDGYSFGDTEVTRIADPLNIKPGSPTTWLTIAINHHITLAARQTSNLYENSEEHS